MRLPSLFRKPASGSRKAHAARGNASRARGIAARIAACSAIGLALAVPAVFVNKLIGYLPLFMYLLMLLMSFLYMRALKHGIVLEHDGATEGCVRGETMPFSVSVRNTTLVPAIRMEAVFFKSDPFNEAGTTAVRATTIPPRSTKQFDFAVRFEHVGDYQIGIGHVRVYDLLNVFTSTTDNLNLQDVSVKPRIFDVASLGVSDEAAVESKATVRSIINEGMDYANVREYRWGDPIKTIHWKLSARSPAGEYVTRLYETATNPGVAIVADWQAPAYPAADLPGINDAVLECTLSLERYTAAIGLDSELIFADASGSRVSFPGPVNGSYDEVLDRFPKISTGDGRLALDLVREASSSVRAPSNIVICTPSITEELVGTALSVKASRRSLLIFAVVPARLDESELRDRIRPLKRLDGTGIFYAVIKSAAELEEGGGMNA